MTPPWGLTAADFAARHDPDAFPASLPRRDRAALPFDPAAVPPDRAVMLDTSVYIQRLRGKLPEPIIACIDARMVRHSAVACAELAIGAGLLHPSHPATARNRAVIATLLGTISATDIVAPSAAAWGEAGMIAGILARTQYTTQPRQARDPVRDPGRDPGRAPGPAGGQDAIRRRLLNDALLFLGAREQGAVLVSMDSTDMDLLLRFHPDAHVLLFALG